MKTVKINYPMALLLIIAILAPLTAVGTPRHAAVTRPIDDQPWGGEIDNRDYKTGGMNSIGDNLNPIPFGITTIRNLGTPMVLLDYLQFYVFDYTSYIDNTSNIKQTNISTLPKSETYSPSTVKTTRFSIRKGR